MSLLVNTPLVKINCSTFTSTSTSRTIHDSRMACEAMMTKFPSLSTLKVHLRHRPIEALFSALFRRPLPTTLHSSDQSLHPHRTTQLRSRPEASLSFLRTKHLIHMFLRPIRKSIMARTSGILCPRRMTSLTKPLQRPWVVFSTLVMINNRIEWHLALSLLTAT
jgi:hypothetical protein